MTTKSLVFVGWEEVLEDGESLIGVKLWFIDNLLIKEQSFIETVLSCVSLVNVSRFTNWLNFMMVEEGNGMFLGLLNGKYDVWKDMSVLSIGFITFLMSLKLGWNKDALLILFLVVVVLESFLAISSGIDK